MQRPWRLLVFGASGAIGGTVASRALTRGWSVVGVSRGTPEGDQSGMRWIQWDPCTQPAGPALKEAEPFDAVCWAQGQNMGDSIADFDRDRHLELYHANVISVMQAMKTLVTEELLSADGARLVVISSIWQERARDHKLSYTVTKAAVGGLVRSASVDLGLGGHLVNAVLPGVTDTPMTRANMMPEQIDAVTCKTKHGRLPDLAAVADTVLFLASQDNTSVSGQSIIVDLGMTNACLF